MKQGLGSCIVSKLSCQMSQLGDIVLVSTFCKKAAVLPAHISRSSLIVNIENVVNLLDDIDLEQDHLAMKPMLWRKEKWSKEGSPAVNV